MFVKWHTLLRLVWRSFLLTTLWRHTWSITKQKHGNIESIFFKGIVSCVIIRQKAAMKHSDINSEELPQPLNLASCWWFRGQRGLSLSMVIHGYWSNASVVLLIQIYLFPCVLQGSSHGHRQRWTMDRCSKEQIMGTESRHHSIEKTDH